MDMTDILEFNLLKPTLVAPLAQQNYPTSHYSKGCTLRRRYIDSNIRLLSCFNGEELNDISDIDKSSYFFFDSNVAGLEDPLITLECLKVLKGHNQFLLAVRKRKLEIVCLDGLCLSLHI